MVVPTGVGKTLRFAPEMSVSEVLSELKIKTKIGGADFGLYQPQLGTKKARWLQKQRTLRFYDITNSVRFYLTFLALLSQILMILPTILINYRDPD